MQNATQYTLRGGHGDDTFTVGTGFTASDSIDGGGGDDSVSFTGGDIVIGTSNVVNVEQYFLGNVTSGFAYNFTITDADMPAGGRLSIFGGALGTGSTLTVDGSAVTSGSLFLQGGAGPDTLIGGAGNDGLGMGGGSNNVVTGGGGGDTINWFNTTTGIHGTAVYNSVSDSTGANYDTFIDYAFAGGDHMQIHALGALPTAIDPLISGGALSKASFDADLEAGVNASNLAAGHAVIFKAHAGDLARHLFLVVDENGVAGYQAGQDLVVDVTVGDHNSLTTAFFN
jgi:Ca2+-binding RTX toxin-like protein